MSQDIEEVHIGFESLGIHILEVRVLCRKGYRKTPVIAKSLAELGDQLDLVVL